MLNPFNALFNPVVSPFHPCPSPFMPLPAPPAIRPRPIQPHLSYTLKTFKKVSTLDSFEFLFKKQTYGQREIQTFKETDIRKN